MNNIVNILDAKAKKLGATEIGISKAKNKRFYVIYNNKIINFGLNTGQTFIDHKNKQIRDAWFKRHSKILRSGSPAYKNKESPSFWSYRILWS